MKKLLNTKLIMVIILILAAFLRLPMLDKLPAGITIDEAGQGYSAYSILKTGRDEWGDFLPLNPRGFGDYKPPVFMYLLVPSIAAFGLNEFAVRFPSAVAGILSVLVIFFLVQELFKNEHGSSSSKSKNLSLLSSFLLAVSPWHVYYSRLGWESNVGLLFLLIGIWLFLKGLKTNKWLVFSVLSFGLAGMSYHSFKLLVPLLVVGLAVIFRKDLLRLNKKVFILPVLVGLVFALILGYGFIFSGAGRRAADQSITKEENLTVLREEQFNDKLPQPLPRVLNNKYEFFLSKITDNYIGYYSLPFLFGPHRSDGSILNFPQSGLLYIWQLPLVLVGIFYLLKNRSKSAAVILLWALSAPIPASLTQDYMHAGRAQALFPVLTIISALGLTTFWGLLPKKFSKPGIVTVAAVVGLSLVLRIDSYLFNTFNHPLGGLTQGYKEITDYIRKDGHDKIILTKAHSEPHAFIAFYSKMDPRIVQQEAQKWKQFEIEGKRYLDMIDYSLGKVEFKNIDMSRDRHEKNALIIGTPEEIMPDQKTKLVVTDLSGKVMFIVVDSNEIAQ